MDLKEIYCQIHGRRGTRLRIGIDYMDLQTLKKLLHCMKFEKCSAKKTGFTVPRKSYLQQFFGLNGCLIHSYRHLRVN